MRERFKYRGSASVSFLGYIVTGIMMPTGYEGAEAREGGGGNSNLEASVQGGQ